jgi:hypothetical protein
MRKAPPTLTIISPRRLLALSYLELIQRVPASGRLGHQRNELSSVGVSAERRPFSICPVWLIVCRGWNGICDSWTAGACVWPRE